MTQIDSAQAHPREKTPFNPIVKKPWEALARTSAIYSRVAEVEQRTAGIDYTGTYKTTVYTYLEAGSELHAVYCAGGQGHTLSLSDTKVTVASERTPIPHLQQ